MNQLVLQGVRPIGFESSSGPGIPETSTTDVAIGPDGRVAAVGKLLRPAAGAAVVDASGCFLSPGWIDLHTHLYEATRAGIHPDLIGPITGVTTLVDAGSAGEATFEEFRRYVIDEAKCAIRCFLNIGSGGLEPYRPEQINLLRLVQCVERNRDIICGIKVLGSRKFVGETWVQPVAAGARVARDLALPCMVHVAEPPVYVEELVELLRAGDIITHCFHGKIGNSLRSSADRILPLYRRAQEKGIRLDVGHGAASFSVQSARLAIDGGVLPFSVSTDLHSGNYAGPVWGLAAVASRMLCCGLSLEQLIPMVTLHPAQAAGLRDYGTLRPGAPSEFTVFSVQEGTFRFVDTGALEDAMSGSDPACVTGFEGTRFVVPRYAVRGTAVTVAEPRGLAQAG